MRFLSSLGLVAIFAAVPGGALAQRPQPLEGAAGYHFLNLGTSARVEALGGAVTSLVDGPDAIVWNPALLARGRGLDVSTSVFNWLDDVRSGYVGGVLHLPLGIGVGMSARVLSVGEFNNVPGGTPIGQSDVAVSAGLGIPILWSPLEAGVSLQVIRSTLDEEAATGASATAGVNLRYVEGWNLSAALRNYGLAFGYGESGVDDQLPTQAALSLGGKLANLRFDGEIYWENGVGWRRAVGGEYWYRERLALRAGSRFGRGDAAVGPWSMGFGIRPRKNFELGYSFRDGDLKPSHRLEVRWTPGRRPDFPEPSARSPREFYLDTLKKVLDESLTSFPTGIGDSVVVRGAMLHDANSLVGKEIARALGDRGLAAEVLEAVAPGSEVQMDPEALESLSPEQRAEAEAALAKSTGAAPPGVPLLEFEVVGSDYEILRSKRKRGIGPRSVERKTEVDLALRLTRPGEAEPEWTSSASSDETETVAVDDIRKSLGYPRPKGTGTTTARPLHPAVEPVIVGGIIAGLAAIFFSNRSVGE